MIQRIQSIYLLVITIIAVLLFFIPIYSLVPSVASSDSAVYNVFILKVNIETGNSVNILSRNWSVIVANSIVLLLSIVAIVIYKNRATQMRLCRAIIFLSISEMIFLYNFYNKLTLVAGTSYVFKSNPFALIIVLIPIFAFLANKAIKKDDNLVRSADRLR